MPGISAGKKAAYGVAYHRFPKAYAALIRRPDEYNKLMARIEQMERDGSAYVFYPQTMPVSYDSTDRSKLEHSFQLGMQQCELELPEWIRWLERRD